MKVLFLLSLVLVSLLLSSSYLAHALSVAAPPPSTPVSDFCNAKCNTRCAKAGFPKRCFKYCCLCCSKCNCVPSGTYGNKSECPCYGGMLNSKGKSKCP